MDFELDKAIKKRTCGPCRKEIKPGTNHIRTSYTSHWGTTVYSNYCYTCSKKEIKKEIKQLSGLLAKLEV